MVLRSFNTTIYLFPRLIPKGWGGLSKIYVFSGLVLVRLFWLVLPANPVASVALQKGLNLMP